MRTVKDYSGPIHHLRNMERPGAPEFLLQVSLILIVCTASYFLAGWWECAVWGFCYVGLQFGEKIIVRLVPASPSGLQFAAVLTVLSIEASVYCFMPVYLWFFDTDVAKFGALALITASSMHSMLNRAVYPSILMCFLVPDAAVFVTISASGIIMHGITAEAVLYLLCGIAISAFFVVMFTQAYRKEKVSLETRSELRQSQKLDIMGRLTGGIAHDFNNLLSVVSGNLQLVPGAKTKAEVLDLANGAIRAANRCADLTAKLLSFGQQAPLVPSVTSPQATFDELGHFLTRLVPSRIELVFDMDPNVGNIYVDSAALQSALLNLVLNSSDAVTKAGKVRVSARPMKIRGVEHVCFEVADDGIGIPSKDLDQVFEPFFSTKKETGGSGLGLSMVKGFVNQSSGSATLTSVEGAGTTVSINLPVTTKKPVLKHASSHNSPAKDRAVPSSKQTVMVVDDNLQLLRAIALLLEREGYAVQSFGNGVDAFAVLETSSCPDLLIADAVMPGTIQGLDVIRRVKQMNNLTPTILISGYADIGNSSGVTQGEADFFISKPIDLSELRSLVHAQLDAPVAAGFKTPI